MSGHGVRGDPVADEGRMEDSMRDDEREDAPVVVIDEEELAQVAGGEGSALEPDGRASR